MPAITEPAPTVRQMSGTEPSGRYILSVLTRRTYRIENDGRCVLAEKQLPLTVEVEYKGDRLLSDTDLFPFKPATDVIVKGHAYAYTERAGFDAGVMVEKFSKTVLVMGNRECGFSGQNRPVFSEPKAFEKIPLRYDYAYGGKDALAESKYGNPLEPMKPFLAPGQDISTASPYIYPRNPCGRGFLVELTREAVEKLALPNLEDPQDRLTPERLAVGNPERWPLAPLPQAFDWFGHGWFPRLAFFGFVPPYEELKGPVGEAARGYAPADIMKVAPQEEKFDFRFANGASLGLQLPYLQGGEECLLVNIHPQSPRFTWRLPKESPKIWTDGRNGKLNKTRPVIHTVIIEPDESRLSIVWRGSEPALRPYMPEELKTMPFKIEW